LGYKSNAYILFNIHLTLHVIFYYKICITCVKHIVTTSSLVVYTSSKY